MCVECEDIWSWSFALCKTKMLLGFDDGQIYEYSVTVTLLGQVAEPASQTVPGTGRDPV
jgi:hypothetical protein